MGNAVLLPETKLQTELMKRFMQGCQFKLKRDAFQRVYTVKAGTFANPYNTWGIVQDVNGNHHCFVSGLFTDDKILFHSSLLDQPTSAELSITDIEILKP